jgi:hypothetical protein
MPLLKELYSNVATAVAINMRPLLSQNLLRLGSNQSAQTFFNTDLRPPIKVSFYPG